MRVCVQDASLLLVFFFFSVT
jgi:serine incorporator 1/3